MTSLSGILVLDPVNRSCILAKTLPTISDDDVICFRARVRGVEQITRFRLGCREQVHP